MSGQELLARVREKNPGLRYAVSASGSCVGEWVPSAGRFAVVYAVLLTGQWVFTGGREVLTDGKPMVEPGDWRE